jgi:hypothetical protein
MQNNKPLTQENFLADLTIYITSHPYFKEQQGSYTNNPDKGVEIFQIIDVDGAYEEIEIKVNLIP